MFEDRDEPRAEVPALSARAAHGHAACLKLSEHSAGQDKQRHEHNGCEQPASDNARKPFAERTRAPDQPERTREARRIKQAFIRGLMPTVTPAPVDEQFAVAAVSNTQPIVTAAKLSVPGSALNTTG